MDLLGDVLLSLKVEANSAGIFELRENWGLDMPPLSDNYSLAHCCIDSPFWLLVKDREPIYLEPGDSVLLLRGLPYALASSPAAARADLQSYWTDRGLPLLAPGHRQAAPLTGLELGEGNKVGRMLTLAFLLQAGDGNVLTKALPPVIHLRGSASGLFPWIGTLLDFLVCENTASHNGYTATASHLSNLILTSFIRAYALSLPSHSTGWLRGLADRRISQALVSMHSHPEASWTAEALAERAGMSRQTFGRLFTKLVGQSPIDYLIALRMQMAAEAIRAGRPVALVAEQVGYQSERAFRELFKRRFGMPPLRYAKQTSIQ
ncbi:AraC family transcriptional regulator [Pseudomonas sp. 13B_2.1_Bac1]|uniref:AraC family transcriptional regulator n=1 Tax=Pseudomonas sp. 13B_2.1_Bac1 TaxID=2971624 RepID=UPI0021C7B037|nr:AraC family transcriptional regulator [Pseudomonas sp. 13B_2.1_Bac1]MCU1785200.1 AraC family transcriptional regulator [Pseudomonas sp. 13B_2.1_Bac1]